MAGNPELLMEVARLYYLEGSGQTEIASLYAVSRSTVSRMLTIAVLPPLIIYAIFQKQIINTFVTSGIKG